MITKKGEMGLKGHRKINFLDVVNALHSQIIFFFGRINVIEFNVVIKAFFTKGNSLVDFDGLWELSVRFQITSFLWRILQNDIGASIL